MKVLNITYHKNEIARFRITSPLILIGRSPLCDISLRAPGVGSVHFIFEWIGDGEFNPEKAVDQEWVVTEVGESGENTAEKLVGQAGGGSGAIFHDLPLQMGDFVFTWVEDRLIEADLDKKLISQQIEAVKSGAGNNISNKVIPILEVISMSREVDSVSAVYHIPFNDSKAWRSELLRQFSATPSYQDGVRKTRVFPPHTGKTELIRAGSGIETVTEPVVDLGMHDLLHIQWDKQELYFRMVPKVYVPAARRAIWSDPFYIISVFCVLIGVFGFFLIFRNLKNEKQSIVAPPRIAQVQILEVKKEEPVRPLAEPEETPPPPDEQLADKKDTPTSDPKSPSEKITPTKNEIVTENSQKVKEAPKVVDRSQGSLKLPTDKAALNRTGFLGALRKTANVGMVKADQILDKGVVQKTVNGESAHFVIDQASSGIVNNQLRKQGDALAAASTQLNFNDKVGNGSLNAETGKKTREGFSASYGVSGEGGLVDSNFEGMVQAEIQGGLDRASVQTAIRGYKSEIRTCYERALRLRSGIGGRVSYKFQILPAGNVNWINVNKNDIDSTSLVECVSNVVKKIKFPVAKNGQSTIVIYPFQFAKKGT